MGYFTITLPGNRQAHVRHGMVRKLSLAVLAPWKKKAIERKKGYLVQVDIGHGMHTTYRVFKTMDGQWQQPDADAMSATICNAIDTYEQQPPQDA